MQFHTGRLFDHVHLRARNFLDTRYFYEAVLVVLGIPLTASGQNWLQADELFIDAADARTIPTHVHLAFQARDPAMVDAFYAAALKAGGQDNGAPGERHYHPGYYACFVIDPDGNNVEAVYHGPSRRSADAITITPET
ncbi:VOC family protein [Devosia faecipullorum]|uniref:VOC family protein n=1 Tax=Devosia faecipullorum TaxID=2755039 RepID=UPI00187B3618|nr:VOC family protein [Devosia faecipullorum]MBE7733015.1 VOC family protein [Devosia faecipullorum]